MNRSELDALLREGENSTVEFKRDDVHAESFAKEMSALLNLEGGLILLGVEDDGKISGLTKTRRKAEEWVMNLARQNLQPPVIPVWQTITLENGKIVGVVGLQRDSPGKPYKAKQGSAWVSFVRVGSTSRPASREEEARLYQAAHLIRYDIKPVPEMGFESLDLGLLVNYFRDILKRPVPDRGDTDGWRRLLLNTDILVETSGEPLASVAGLLLFGENPNRRLPQAGVTATAFSREAKDYDTVDEEIIRGPLVSLISKRGRVVEKGVI
ncbi:MAG TPA: RNA-binding domain-containing protein, partial [Thermoanaerobaculia bacterium]|nr:RNA-binding domain-containing protein [Thermoanaerobaculia bacterium]